MSIIDTGGLPCEIVFVYTIATNIDVSDGLTNVGKSVRIERDDSGTFVWLEFPDSSKTGEKF